VKIDYEKLTIYNDQNHNEIDVKITVSGDWCPISGNMSNYIVKLDSDLYGDLLPLFDKSDYNFFNLETAIDDSQNNTRSPWEFIDKSRVISVFKDIKLNVACLANNHILDGGVAGLNETIRCLDSQGIHHIGADLTVDKIYKPLLINKKKSNFAIINVADGEQSSEGLNNNIGSADLESYHVYDSIRNEKNNNSAVIVIVHAGIEFSPVPPPFITKIYQSYIDCGADIVIGHHPHVIQGCQMYREKPIFYSLGHFYLYRENSRPQEKIGMLLSISISKNNISRIKLKPFKIQSDKISLLKGGELDKFKSKFKYLSDKCCNQEFIHEFFCEYVNIKKYPLVFRRINNLYMYDHCKFFITVKKFTTSLNTRHLFMANGSSLKYNQEIISLINEYKLANKVYFLDRIYLMFKGVYKATHTLWVNIKLRSKKLINL
jgi:hypothetical protein